MVADNDLAEAASMLAAAGKVAVLTGAGVSKESGLPTFREPQTGLWARYDPQKLASLEGFRHDPHLVWSWYMYRLGLVSQASPNAAHHAIAQLESLVPEVVVLTQNIDGLHQQAGSSRVEELHGSIRRFKCAADCQGAPTVIKLPPEALQSDRAPHCPHCDEFVRPDVVWFGETLPGDVIDRAFTAAATCNVMLVVGTSGVVQPAASLPFVARQYGADVIEVNPQRSEVTRYASIYLQGSAAEVLPALFAALQAQRAGAG